MVSPFSGKCVWGEGYCLSAQWMWYPSPNKYVEFLLELSRGSNLAAEKHLEEILTLQVAVRPHLVMIQDLPPEFCQLS